MAAIPIYARATPDYNLFNLGEYVVTAMDVIEQAEFDAYYFRNRRAIERTHAAWVALGCRSTIWADELLYHAACGATTLPDGARRYELLSYAVARYLDENVIELGLDAAAAELGLIRRVPRHTDRVRDAAA